VEPGDALLPLLFNNTFEYATRKVRENLLGLKLNGTNQLLAEADNINVLGDNVATINKAWVSLIEASEQVGLEIIVEKTKYLLLSRDENAGTNRDINTFF
jgi:hypothetical protein